MPGSQEAEATSATKDASELVLKETEQVLAYQLDNFNSLTTKAGTVLSVLIGAITATLTLGGLVARPPVWAILVPAIPLIAALIVSSLVFMGSEVATGPRPESLVNLTGESESEVRSRLIEFYKDLIAGSKPKAGEEGFVGNRELLHHKQKLFEVSVILLAITIVTLIGVALALYSP